MRSILLFVIAGLFEIGGGYLVWLWLRESRSMWLGLLGFFLLSVYGLVLVLQPQEHPFGRIYAAYGAVFIILSVLWGWGMDGKKPDMLDLIGSAICVAGATLMMWPRKGF